MTIETLRIVIASPADVAEERETVVRVADELNHGLAADRGIIVQVARWETDAYPGFHIDGPQGLIDSVLKLEDADCLIGIFWKRFGTPVKDAASGTAHELSVAYQRWKKVRRPQVMVYFSDRPYKPKSVDEAEQSAQVLRFQGEFPKEGLWWTYNEPTDFERLVRGHLTNWLRDVRPLRVDPPTSESIGDRRIYVQRYSDLVDEAKKDVLIMANKFHRSEAVDEAAKINESLRKAAQRGVRIRMLNGPGFDRLPGALELAYQCGAEVRFDPDLPVSDMNFACSDSHHVLIGLRQASADLVSYRRSTAWNEFRSTYLAAVLKREFERRWLAARTRSLGLLMRQLLPGAIDELGLDGVAEQLHLEAEAVKTIVNRPPLIVSFIGRPGAGKTTVATAVLRSIEAELPGLRAKHISDLEFVRQAFAGGKATGRYEPTEDGGFFITDRTLYNDALVALAESIKNSVQEHDIVLAEFARKDYVDAFSLLERQGIHADLIIYLDVPFAVAHERNRDRAVGGQGHFVSEREMRETYEVDDLARLQEIRKVSVLRNEQLKRLTAEHAMSTVLEIVRAFSSRP